MFETVSTTVIGYSLNVVGLFFLASAITFKKPRREIEESLGVERQRSLSTVRDHLVNQVQTYIGFVFLVAGHVLLMGDALLTQSREAGRDVVQSPNLVPIVLVLLVSTIATMAMLKIVQLLFTRRSFRRLLAEVVADSGYELEKNQKVAVQIGELLGLPKGRDQSVPEYIQEVCKALGLNRSRTEPRSRAVPRLSHPTE